MRDSGIVWIGDIPESWKVARLKNIKSNDKYAIVDGPFGTAISTSDYRDSGVPLLRIINLNGNKLDTNDLVYITEEHADSISRSKFHRGDIIFAKTGATVGKCAINSNIDEGVLSSSCVKISISEEYDKKYFYYFFSTKQFNDALRNACNGTTRDTINLNPFSCLECVVPPICDQKAISEYLDKKCLLLDSAIVKTRESIDEYRRLKEALITETVLRGVHRNREYSNSGYEWIGEIPVDWELIKLKWVLNERKEKSETGEEEPLSMSQKFGIIPTKEMDIVPNMASSFVGAKIVHDGDLVFNKLKAHLGVFSVSKYYGLVSPDYAVYFANENVNAKYLEYLFKTPQYINEFKKKSSGVGAGLTRLYTKDLFSIYIALPSMEEQDEIVDHLSKKIAYMNNLISKKEVFLDDLEKYKSELIFEYVTGKKEVPQS